MYARGQVFLKIVPVFIAGTPAFVYNLYIDFAIVRLHFYPINSIMYGGKHMGRGGGRSGGGRSGRAFRRIFQRGQQGIFQQTLRRPGTFQRRSAKPGQTQLQRILFKPQAAWRFVPAAIVRRNFYFRLRRGRRLFKQNADASFFLWRLPGQRIL